ncbi:ATP-dependent nuclease [Metallibacterium scheffleri]|uniref:ATP-dependent endonuclease n=1 Tax=Metallibacterium scheffleri TaxID=993689 RepID=A0A4S3KMK6_9GAMM|nr:AAA family ATPase [Metallibacterium scheffleri]THD10143.1 ATP-dependent endonuclease [Metallibacterium scheffleri]
MHISKISLVNYRNFANAKLIFNKGINTIIGENGSGKTNLFRAIRLLLDDNLLRSAHRLDEKDFHRGLEQWQGHWIIISIEFQEVSQDEAIQSLFLHGTGSIGAGAVSKATYNLIFRPKVDVRLRLSELTEGDRDGMAAILSGISIEDYETIFTGRSEADFNDPVTYAEIVGDFKSAKFGKELDHPAVGSRVSVMLSVSKEISFTFVQALRDVIAEFQNNRTNPLLNLLKRKSGEIDPVTFLPITEKVRELNDAIERLDDVQTVRSDIVGTIKEAAGESYSPSSLSIRSDLSDEADKLFQSLKLFVGETGNGYEGAVHELSLGGANLIYLTLKLLEFKYQKANQSFANFLLIEEPEAHIHTHIQKTLFDRLNFADTQIIYSTHSTHISEASNVENMNILSRVGKGCETYQPTTGLDPVDIGNIQRYLDAVRSNLLFAKSVMLVEGDAEEILIPILVKKVLGITLDELGISLINIRSTGFQNVAVLFHDDRIKKRCAIVTDSDATFFDTTPAPADDAALSKFKSRCASAQTKGLARKAALDAFSHGNPWVECFYAPHTFEVDFVDAGNAERVIGTIAGVYKDPATIAKAKTELESKDIAVFGKRALLMANYEGKGWFAIALGNQIDHEVIIPDYIVEAIHLLRPALSTDVWFHILSFRLACIETSGMSTPDVIQDARDALAMFRSGEMDLAAIKALMLVTFTSDPINRILNKVG